MDVDSSVRPVAESDLRRRWRPCLERESAFTGKIVDLAQLKQTALSQTSTQVELRASRNL
jgi:hypothetical protein